MANLQIKGMNDDFYAEIKELAGAENRSVSQQIVFITKEYLAKKSKYRAPEQPHRYSSISQAPGRIPGRQMRLSSI